MTNKNNNVCSFARTLPGSVVLLSSALMLLLAPAAFADWRINPLLRVGGEYDDNADLSTRTDREIELQGYLLEASADFVYSAPRTTFNVLPRVLSRNYSKVPEFESTDLFLVSRFNHKMKSSAIGFRVNFDQQTVRTAERSDADSGVDNPDDIPDDDSGRVGVRGNRSKWRFTPKWSYQVTELSSVSADIDYFDVRYGDVFAGLLTDYTDARLNLNYRRDFSSRNAFLLTATGRNFQSANAFANEVTGYGMLVGFDRDMSEKSRLRALIGVENTQPSVGDRVSQVVGNVTYTQRLETITLLAQYRRSISASGAGRTSSRDQVNVNFLRRLNEKISAGLGIRAYRSVGLGGSFSIDNRDYAQLRTNFVWHFSPSFQVEADYRYTVLDRGETLGERANSNRVTLWFVYQPNSTR
jgi:hypothetical protein